MLSWPQAAVHTNWIFMVLVASWPSDTNLTSSGSPDYRPLHSPQWPQEPQISTHVSSAASGPRLALGNSPGITLDSGGKQAFHISLFLSQIWLSPQPMNRSAPLHLPTLYSLIIMVPYCPCQAHSMAQICCYCCVPA